MAKVQSWSPDDWKKNLAKRLKQAKKYRQRFEPQWTANERTVFYWNSRQPDPVYTLGEDDTVAVSSDGLVLETEMAVNYAWKFLRFIHSQMSANPPSVIARPASPDPDDRQKADAADRVIRHGYHDKDAQELFDLASLKCLTYGTAWVKVGWDPDAGDTFEFDEATSELTMDGDIMTRVPSTWDMWVDPDARCWREVRYVFERIEMPLEEAKFRWSEQTDVIERFVRTRPVEESELEDWREKEDLVEVYQYTEKALPINGMAGRAAYCLEDGTPLGKPTKNLNPGEVLGYCLMTDIDVPDQVYGKSFIDYVQPLQLLLNRLDTSFVDNIAAHNVVRMVLPDGAEIEDTALSNSAWDYVKITGGSGQGPYYAPAASLMPDAHKLRENLINATQELAGVNDALQGHTGREVSGFAMQTMIEQGNATRRRLFNKYTSAVRDFWKLYLAVVREHWDDPRKILVLGKERAFEAAYLSGSDVNGGFDIVCEYGASLSLDPARRREEIMQLQQTMEKAGVPPKTILGMLKLNELEGIYDRMQLSETRQREDFDGIIATRRQAEPVELQDHAGRLDYAYYFIETSAFKYLDDVVKQLIWDHVKKREQFAAQAAAKGQAAAAGAPQPGADPAAAAAAPMPPPAAPAPAPVAVAPAA